MQVLIKNIPDGANERIILECSHMTREFENIRDFALSMGNFITGYIDGSAYRLNISDILYFEAVGEEVFAYTEDEFYSVKKRLYEIEKFFADNMFMRCSKSMVINLCQIGSLRSAPDSRYIAKMKNGEDIIVSRTYSKEVRKRFSAL